MTNSPLLLLVALAALALGLRWAGFLAAARSERAPSAFGRFLAVLPPSLLAALVASSAADGGTPALIAVGAALALFLVAKNELIAAFGGVGLAFGLSLLLG